ncbi:hypothetical protein BJY00DRAFT_302282 [Aspergillus carlsbadensis]|nr:hypothetical protein BJY00DRAFT_302282 [Aspergillus carlsbadensis]
MSCDTLQTIPARGPGSVANTKAIESDGQFIVRTGIHDDDLEFNELLIKTHYSDVNPADIRHSTFLGIRSTVVGYVFAGRVISSPPGSKYKEDDITHVATLAVVVMTAADAIHNLSKTALPTSPGCITAPILIWGASSSVGISAVQLARAGGYRNIFVTASPSRHALLRDLGATQAFNYTSPTVIEDIKSAVEALGEGPIAHALEAVGSIMSSSTSFADVLAQAVSDSAAVLAYVVIRSGIKFQMPVAALRDGWTILPPRARAPALVSLSAAPTRHRNFKVPVVEVLDVTPEEAFRELMNFAEGTRAFRKVVLKDPFRYSQ